MVAAITRTSTREGRRLAERTDFARFEEAEQLRLELDGELADFVEEQRAAAGGADDAGVIAVGAGEGAAAVAEELALHHLARHGGAVEGDERFVGAMRVGVDGAREDLLAGAALAGDQDAGVRRRDAFGQIHGLAHAAVDDGLADVLDRDVFDGPERQTLFALGATALDLVDGRQQQRDGVERRDRFDVVFRCDPHFDGSLLDVSDIKRVGAASKGAFVSVRLT